MFRMNCQCAGGAFQKGAGSGAKNVCAGKARQIRMWRDGLKAKYSSAFTRILDLLNKYITFLNCIYVGMKSFAYLLLVFT